MERSYAECRDEFVRALPATAEHEAHAIDEQGPDGESLTIDVARLGPRASRRLLVVTSGVHGVEGPAGSMIQRDLLRRVDDIPLGSTAVLLVHAVNPYGMAWWRRQNESNVDLNRNWARDELGSPPRNAEYDEIHDLLCPDGDEPPAAEPFLAELRRLVDTRGAAWVKSAISRGQFHHPDGLYFGGDVTEASTRIVTDIVERHASGAELVVAADLHTGHGAWGTSTILTDAPDESSRARWLRETFARHAIEFTADPGATTPIKQGQIVGNLGRLLPSAEYHHATFELGTVSDARMIVAERAEHWAHRHGDRDDPAVAEIRLHHLGCSAPEDPTWIATARRLGAEFLDDALRSLL